MLKLDALLLIIFFSLVGDPVESFGVTFRLVRTLGPQMIKSLMSREDRSTRRRLDQLISSLSTEMMTHVPSSVGTRVIDRTLSLGYICSTTGTLSGMETMKKIDKIEFSRNEDGSSNVSIRYHFDNLKLHYRKFAFKYVFTAEMELELNYPKNTLLVELRIESLSAILWRVLSRNCVMHVTKVELIDLGDVQVEVKTQQSDGMLKPIMQRLFRMNHEVVRNSMNEKLNVEIYNGLMSSGSFLCRDQSLEDLVLDKYALEIAILPRSEEYYKLCGQQ